MKTLKDLRNLVQEQMARFELFGYCGGAKEKFCARVEGVLKALAREQNCDTQAAITLPESTRLGRNSSTRFKSLESWTHSIRSS